MNYILRLKVLYSLAELLDIISYLQFMKKLSPLDQFIKCLVFTEFKQDVNIFLVLKEVLKLNYSFMVQTLMYFYFGIQFFLIIGFVQGDLGYNFRSRYLAILNVCEMKTMSKASAA